MYDLVSSFMLGFISGWILSSEFQIVNRKVTK